MCVFRDPEAPVRSSLSPAGAPPSASPHCTPFPFIPPQQSKPLRVRVVTFNMNFKAPTEVPDELLGRSGCPDGLTKYDIVVVGTQESGPLQVRSSIQFISMSITCTATHRLIHSQSLLLVRSLTHSLALALPGTCTHSLTHLLTHSLTHSCASQARALVASSSHAPLLFWMHSDSCLPETVSELLPGIASNTCTVDSVLLLHACCCTVTVGCLCHADTACLLSQHCGQSTALPFELTVACALAGVGQAGGSGARAQVHQARWGVPDGYQHSGVCAPQAAEAPQQHSHQPCPYRCVITAIMTQTCTKTLLWHDSAGQLEAFRHCGVVAFSLCRAGGLGKGVVVRGKGSGSGSRSNPHALAPP